MCFRPQEFTSDKNGLRGVTRLLITFEKVLDNNNPEKYMTKSIFAFPLPIDTPGPPGSVKVKEVSKDSVTITWEIPTIDGGAPVSNYIIEKREAAMRAYKTVTTKCSKTLYRISGLIEGALYYFRVLPENIYGIGEPCETSDAVLVSEVPTAPQKLEVVDVTKSTVSLAWDKPQHDGGSRLTGYVIEASKAGSERWMKVVTLKPTVLEHTIISLNEGEQYLFRVRAQNQKGVSEAREIVTAVTVQELKGMNPDYNEHYCL